MRDLLLGIFLGVWLTMLVTWLEKHRMENYIDVVFYALTGLLVFII